MYKAVYLPVDKPFTDGCTIIDSIGRSAEWDAAGIYAASYKTTHKVAELFIVGYEYNQMVIIGQPAQRTGGWIKEGMDIKVPNVASSGWHIVPGIAGRVSLLDVRCDACGHVHK